MKSSLTPFLLCLDHVEKDEPNLSENKENDHVKLLTKDQRRKLKKKMYRKRKRQQIHHLIKEVRYIFHNSIGVASVSTIALCIERYTERYGFNTK